MQNMLKILIYNNKKSIRNSEEQPRYFLSIKLILIVVKTNMHNYIPNKHYCLSKHYTTHINHLLEYKNTIKSKIHPVWNTKYP